ncbi:hypothetical protein [Empedobacter sp. UBA5528]|uniref:hypothetical protein n=1 Tax=Empedobacter sp. UBA5528 TaxID=1946440 RepID=UPI0025C53586|nr:hypothetical protein [Empedobacter sp. UBA5528]
MQNYEPWMFFYILVVFTTFFRKQMRIVAELPVPQGKITIFSMNAKYIVKIEKGQFEQTFKIAELNLSDGLDSVFAMLDDRFMTTVEERFKSMSADFNDTWKRHEYPSQQDK